MIDDISQAFIEELQTYVNADTTGMYARATVMIDTDFNITNVPTYILPLIILEIDEAPSSRQLIGAPTQMEWNINIVVYVFEPDPYGAGTYGTGLLAIVDDLRQHFAGAFLSPKMDALVTKYMFNNSFTGIVKAQEIEKNNKVVIGRKIQYESVGIDFKTASTIDSTSDLTYIVDNTIQLSVNTITESATGGTIQFNITTDIDWTLTLDQNWATANYYSGTGNKTIILTIAANSGNQRIVNVSVSGINAATKSIVLTQAGA